MNRTLAAAIALLLAACDTRHQRCVANGGTWTAVNCHDEDSQICTTTDFGNNMAITTCIPMTSTVCDYVCRGATPEAKP